MLHLWIIVITKYEKIVMSCNDEIEIADEFSKIFSNVIINKQNFLMIIRAR